MMVAMMTGKRRMMTNLIDKIAALKCPECKTHRMLAGPFYNRKSIRCLECGWKGKIK